MFSINAKFPINKLIVKPMPVKIETPYKPNQFELFGIFANLNLIEIYENNNTPICFPKNNPSIIPRGTGSNKFKKDKSSKLTPALANAKIGIIKNATQEEIVCCGGFKNVYDYRLRSNDMIADRNWLTIDDLKIIFEEYPIDTEVRDLSMTNRNFLTFDRIGVQAKNKDDLKRALELSISLSENVLVRKIVVTNDPTNPSLKGKLYIAVIREPSSGFWIFDIQSYLKGIKDFIIQMDLKSLPQQINDWISRLR